MIKEVHPVACSSSKCTSSGGFSHWQAGDVLGLALMFSAALWAIYVHYSVPVLPYDDGYITFRYVDNLLRGRGLVYNQGENVFGSTTPLYIFLLMAAKWFSHQPIPDLAVRLNIIPFLLCGVGTFCLVRYWSSSMLCAGIGASVFWVSLDMLTASSGGMETFVFLALVLFTFLILEAQPPRPVWAGVLSGLAILTRPEGILLIPIGFIIFRKSMREILKFIAWLSLALAPWVAFASMKFGTPIPMSLIAKSRGVYPLAPGDALLMMVAKVADWAQVETPIGYHAIFGKLNHLFAPRMMLLIFLLIVGSWACAKYSSASGKNAWIPSLYLILLLIMYGFGNPFIFDWYMPPVYMCILLSL